MRKPTRSSKWVSTFLLTVVAITSGFLLFHHANGIVHFSSHLIQSVSEKGSLILGSTAAPVAPLDIPPAPVKVRVMVSSNPPGAIINLDGQDLGTTPGEILVMKNKRADLSLRRDGYIPYTTQLVAANTAQNFTATLQKAVVGYLNIDVRPTTATIFINGGKLAEKTPIMRYPVPAGKSLVIKAINPYLNTFDEQRVIVKQDTVKDVTLFLHK